MEKLETNFKDILSEEILKGHFNHIFIEKGYLPTSKLNKSLNHQEFIDIVKKITGKEKGSKQSVKDWLTGSSPKLEVLIALADVLEVTVDWLLGRTQAKSLDAQEGYEPFKQLGFSYEAWKTLTKYKDIFVEEEKDIHSDDPDYLIPDDYMVENKYMKTLSSIIENCNFDGDETLFPILEGLYRYIDVVAQSPFYKVNSTLFAQNIGIIATGREVIDESSDFYKPYTKEEIEDYVMHHNFTCSPNDIIDIATFNPKTDKKCDNFIKYKRAAEIIVKQIENRSEVSNLEEMDNDAFHYLKSELRKLKIEEIKKAIEFQRSWIDRLSDSDNNSLYMAQNKIEELEKLLSYYEKN